MKKRILSVILFGLALVSCERDTTPTNEGSVLSFQDEASMSDKISRIEKMQREIDLDLLDKILSRTQLEPLNEAQLKAAPVSNQPVDLDKLAQDVNFYHTQRLEGIYKMRQDLNFTSIQSIADEVNSLMALDPQKAEQLYQAHAGSLKKSSHMVIPVFDERLSNILNTSGEVVVGDKKIAFDPVAASNDTANRGETTKGGTIAISPGNVVLINYYSGARTAVSWGIYSYYIWSQTTSFVSTNGGSSWVLYPSVFGIVAGSKTAFQPQSIILNCPPFDVVFLNGFNTYVKNEMQVDCAGYTIYNGIISGNFATPISGGYIYTSGSATF